MSSIHAAALEVDLRLSDVHSLKEKRHRLKALGSDIRKTFPVGFADARSPLTPLPLPLPLPGGCLLHVEPFSTTVSFTDSTGTACRPLPLPATPSLDGVLLFAQALPFDGAALTATPGLALLLGL